MDAHLRVAGCALAAFLAWTPPAGAAFISTDVLLSVYTDTLTFAPGDTVVFEALVTNVSSTTMAFGENIRNAGMGTSVYVGNEPIATSPYIESFGFYPPAFSNGLDGIRIGPGESYSFAFIFVETLDTIPPGTAVALRPPSSALVSTTSLELTNIPPTVPNPANDPNNFDFFVVATEQPSAVAVARTVPEPGSRGLIGIALLALSLHRRERGSRGRPDRHL